MHRQTASSYLTACTLVLLGSAQHAAAQAEPTAASLFVPPVFAYTDFGPPGKVASDLRRFGDGTRAVAFANNVLLTLKQMPTEGGHVAVSVRVGHGLLDLPDALPGHGGLIGEIGEGGLERHSADELKRMFEGRMVSASFTGMRHLFGGNYYTTQDDLLLQLQVAAAYTVAPGFRPEAEAAWRAAVAREAGTEDADPFMAYISSADRALAGGDRRVGISADDQAHLRTFAELKPAILPVLSKGEVEIALIGEFDEQRAIDAVARTFGALPERSRPSGKYSYDPPILFRKERTPIVVTHRGASNEARAGIVWSVPVDPSRDLGGASIARLLSNVLRNKVAEKVKNSLGEPCTHCTTLYLDEVTPGFNRLEVATGVAVPEIDQRLGLIRDTAARLGAGEISDKDLNDALKQELDGLASSDASPGYWVWLLSEAQSRPAATELRRVAAREAALRAVTKADLVRAASSLFATSQANEVRVIPRTMAQP